MLYKNIKVRVRTGHRDYFDIITGVLQRYILAPYQFIIC